MTEIAIEEFYKQKNIKPAYDSSGGGDYVDTIDSLNADKFNHRWNVEDAMFLALQKHLRKMNGLNINKVPSYFYEQKTNDVLANFNEKPFQFMLDTNNPMDFIVKGNHSAIGLNDPHNIVLPLTDFIDLIYDDETQFSIITGNTNLFEIQTDAPNSSKRWYRLGHDGAEGTPALVTVQHALNASVQYAVIEIIFEDYQNNPTTKDQVIRIKGDDHNEYIELRLDPDNANYQYTYGLWNGSSLQTGSGDTGISRTSAIHTFQIICLKNTVKLYLDNSNFFTSTVGQRFEYVDDLQFESENNSGSNDYFDILRFNCYHNKMFTLTANTKNYIYINVSDGSLSVTTSIAVALNGIILYMVDVPVGASSLIDDYVTDLRTLSNFYKQYNYLEDYVETRSLANLPILPATSVDFNGQAITNVGNVDGVDVSAIALDNMPALPTSAVDFNSQNIIDVGTVDGVDVSELSLSNLPKLPTSAVDFNSQNIIDVGTVDGVDVSAIKLNSMPAAADGDIDCNGQAITNVGTVDGVDVSGLVIDSIADSDVSHAPSRNAVFDALALKQDNLTFGIANDNALKAENTPEDNDYAKFTATGLEGRSYSEVKTDLSLNNVENIQLSTWAGTSNIITIGTLTSGDVRSVDSIGKIASKASGDLFYWTTALQRLAKGSDNELLTLSSSVPTWKGIKQSASIHNIKSFTDMNGEVYTGNWYPTIVDTSTSDTSAIYIYPKFTNYCKNIKIQWFKNVGSGSTVFGLNITLQKASKSFTSVPPTWSDVQNNYTNIGSGPTSSNTVLSLTADFDFDDYIYRLKLDQSNGGGYGTITITSIEMY